jgi:sulfonate transport system substrate-binding protein
MPTVQVACPAAASAVDMSKVTLTIGSPCKTCLARLLIASGQDQNTPYTIKWADFDSTPPLIEALKAGHVDVAQGGETGVLFGVANGTKIKILGATDESGEGGSLILVKNSSEIKTVADLKGKRVALPYYTAQHYQLAKALDKAGVAWGDADIVNLNTTDGLSALNTGAVQAFVVWDPNSAVAEVNYESRALQNLKDAVKTYGTFYATEAAVNDPGKRAALEDLTRRVVRANNWVHGHKEDWAQQVAELSKLPIEPSRRAANRTQSQLAPIDEKVVTAWQEQIDYFHGLGQFKQSYKASDLVAPGFDKIIADELTKLPKP